MKMKGIFGPFENPDDINKYWYQVTEKELGESIDQVKSDLEDSDNDKGTAKILEQDLEGLTKELKNLSDLVDEYTRCTERYKHDKKTLQQVQDDWSDYNSSLYADYCRHQSMMLDSDRTRGEGLKTVRKEAKLEMIKREEIERRMKTLLSM